MFSLRLFLDLVMSWLCEVLLVTTTTAQNCVRSSRACGNSDFLHTVFFFAQRALFDAATPTSLVNDSDTLVSPVAVATNAEGTQRHVMDKEEGQGAGQSPLSDDWQYVWVRARRWCPTGRGRILLHLRIGASRSW